MGASGSSFRSCVRLAGLTMIGIIGTLALEGTAHAACSPPAAHIVWTYPDESTASVPPAAVFWAVIDGGGNVAVYVDGVALAPLGAGSIERHQFVPEAPLAPGQHELLVRAIRDGSYDLLPQTNERRLTFDVSSGSAVVGDVTIDAISFYPSFERDQRIDNPTGEDLADDCSPQAVPLTLRCNDSFVFEGYTRVEYRAEGAPIAYLVQGDTLLPAACASLWLQSARVDEPAVFNVAPVLATGIGSEHSYDGALEIRGVESTARGGCSLGSDASSSSGSNRGAFTAFGSALVGGLLTIRMAKRARPR